MTPTGRRGVRAVARRALITLAGQLENDSPGAAAPRRDIERALDEDTPLRGAPAGSVHRAMTEQPRWWTVRRAQNLKPTTYRCPFCGKHLPALSEHALVMPEDDASRRRHAHTACVVAARRAGRLPARDEWLETQPRRPGLLRRLLHREPGD